MLGGKGEIENISECYWYFLCVISLATVRKILTSRSNTNDCFALIVFEISHPLRPVFRLGAPGFGPKSCRVEFAMPLQRPQLFKAYFPHRWIHKETHHVPIVSIHTETPHLIGTAALSPNIGAIPIIFTRLICGQRGSADYCTVSKI